MSEYKLVPADAIRRAASILGSQGFEAWDQLASELESMIASVPAVQGEPLGYVIPRMAARLGKGELCGISVLDQPEDGHTLPVYLAPQTADHNPAPDVSALVEALEQIQRWDGFPSTDKTWEGSGEPVSYGAAFGSNGERDFIQEVAHKALAAWRQSNEA